MRLKADRIATSLPVTATTIAGSLARRRAESDWYVSSQPARSTDASRQRVDRPSQPLSRKFERCGQFEGRLFVDPELKVGALGGPVAYRPSCQGKWPA
jgi:hypothetical protein